MYEHLRPAVFGNTNWAQTSSVWAVSRSSPHSSAICCNTFICTPSDRVVERCESGGLSTAVAVVIMVAFLPTTDGMARRAESGVGFLTLILFFWQAAAIMMRRLARFGVVAVLERWRLVIALMAMVVTLVVALVVVGSEDPAVWLWVIKERGQVVA